MCNTHNPVGLAVVASLTRLNAKGASSITNEEVNELLHLFTMFVATNLTFDSHKARQDCDVGGCKSRKCESYEELLKKLCDLSLEISYGRGPSDRVIFDCLSKWIVESTPDNYLIHFMPGRQFVH